jgi:hypothetical protein
MTPSGWGDDAPSDAGHDEMQVRVYRDELRRAEKGSTITRLIDAKPYEFVTCYAELEMPIIAKGRAIAFVDVAVQHYCDDKGLSEENRLFWWFLEVKPVIRSIGSVVRQCKAIDAVVKHNGPRNRGGRLIMRGDVFAVVYEDDPKSGLLLEMYPYTFRLPRSADA